MLTEVMITPVKGGLELQTSVSTMLQTLSSHNPTGFSDWIARNVQLGNEPWLVQWSYALSLHVEETVPRENDEWNETTPEFKEFDRVFSRVLQMWRTLLDHTAEMALVDQLVKYLQALMQTEATQQWNSFMLKKLQTHFVDIADVLIGWTMSTGPYSPLRCVNLEILMLLHQFGRLWADNSVFSLQLLNSFADEIVNLCESWKDHVEGDDDRLSTLLACFMMVAQCVPDLALPADESTECSFEKVLHRVASCSQPEYSLFCVANCSDYLVSMSNARHRRFAPLSVTAVRFLLYHAAVQSRSHDSEVDKLSLVMENACKLASANFSSIDGSLLMRDIAIAVLEDDIPSRHLKKGGQPKRVKVMECLFHIKCVNAVRYATQLCLQLTRLGGINALKVLSTRALQRLNGRNGDKGNSYFVFVATCFVLVSREPESLKFVRDDGVHTIAILELITTKLEKQNCRHHRLTPRQLCLVLKMALAFMNITSGWIVDQIGVVEIMSEVSLRMLECAVSILSSEIVVIPDYRLGIETLKVIDGILSQTGLVQRIPTEVCRHILEKVANTARSVNVKAKEESIRVLETLYSRAEAREISGDVFEVLLDLLLDPSQTVQSRVMPDALNGVSGFALLSQNKQLSSRHVSHALHPSFVSADFENIMSHFQFRESDESEWNRVCGSIASRTMSDVAFSNSGILVGAIRQAAMWCVHNRLRTHFGGPAQSFANIERLLQEYSDEAQYATGRTSQNIEAPAGSNRPSHWISNWLMLEFVGELELRMSRAICTTDVDQTNPESDEYKTVLFYRTNKGVCDDWLSRIRPFLVDMSKNGSSYELHRYYSHAMMTTCYSKLSRAMISFTSRDASEKISNDVRQAEQDLDSALYSLCKCHCDAKDSDSVIGFQKWGGSISSALSKWYHQNKGDMDIAEEQCDMPHFRWLSAARYEAAMRYADAATEYESLLEPVLKQNDGAFISAVKVFESPMKYLRISPPALFGCIKQCAACYVALRDWTKLRQFIIHFVELSKFLVDSAHPIHGIQAILGCFDNSALCPDNVNDRFRDDLIPLALQSSPWNGYAGEKIGKKAEETLLRMFRLSKKNQLSTGKDQVEALVKELRMNSEIYDSAIWGQLYTPSLNGQSGSADADCLYLTGVARLARKQHNFGLAQELLREATAIEGTNRVTSMTITYEKSKLLDTIGMEDEGRRLIVAQCESSLESIISKDKCSGQENMIVRSLVHLAKSFTKPDSADLMPSPTSRFLDDLLTHTTSEVIGTVNCLSDITLSDESAYRCLQAAITVSPASAKGWIHYSHWCYDRGKREIERITEQNGYIHLDPVDEAEMNSLLDELGISELDRDDVVRAFCHFLDNDELVTSRLDEFHQLCADRITPDHNIDTMERLIQLQQTCRSKVLQFHALSARGYGKYLKTLLSGSNSSVSSQEIIMVALRLLGLLTTYGTEKDVMSELEDVFSNGPVDPWSYVVPQLIARACHPVVAVSNLVCLILKRLAHHSPHAIVYPAVVDSMEPQNTLSNCEERGTTTNTFAAVLQELYNASSGQADGVRLLISELRRISVLWDEYWITSLVKLSADVSRRSSTLKKEATRVEKNASLSAKEKSELAHRKLVAIMKPIYVSIERLWEETCGGVSHQHAVSPHERKFMKDYGGLIEKAMENFRDCFNSETRVNPPPRMTNPQELWQPFEDMLKSLVNAASRREQLPLPDISPALASTCRQLVMTNMPGIFSGSTIGRMKPITIHRVDSSVAVLRTKTKPKSMILIGSDGETYKYLLKAREDLRLDERIMQFLRVTNEFLRADDAAAARDLSAQSYSVIPISKNAGLIQMVPDVVPLFQVYTARNDSNGRAIQDPVATAQHQPPPPTAQFYAKLKQHGIANVAPNHRSQWPASTLKQVYQELVAQRPRNVLQHEILLRSEDIRESWSKSLRFSKSLAVMSVLGYIVGLGDRHLDNILLCVNSGDVVHIDHNVCFDKGRRLKVPEIVPFRLTPMLQDALGFTGVDGSFRVAFKETLRIVRSDDVREALLTLLETFVYSPLVDWIAEDKRQERSGDLKARLEVNVNLSLFLSRAEERRQETISFGRQYEQYADTISRVVKCAEIPFMALLEQRKHLLSLECEEQALLKTISCVEAELSEHQNAEQIKRTEADTATALAEDITTKMTSFADECLARHRQIELWRQKSISFAENDPLTQLGAVTKAAESVSFLNVHATLCSVLEQAHFASQQKELLAALEKKCREADEDVVRLRTEIERLATYLIPYLSYYGHQRKELDEYLDFDVKVTVKDIYFKWWNICTECLRGVVDDQDTGNTDTILAWSAPPEDNICESRMLLRRVAELNANHMTQVNEAEEASCLSQADNLLHDIWNAVSAMELSNGQGQHLLKLTGASWIIGVMERLLEENWASNIVSEKSTVFTPTLEMPATFGTMESVSFACSTLLDFVSSSKGSMTRLRACELLVTDRGQRETVDMGLNAFNDILQAVGWLAIVIEEEFLSNLHERQLMEDVKLLGHIKKVLAVPNGTQVLMDTVFKLPTDSSNGETSSIQKLFADYPAVYNVFAAAFDIVRKVSTLADILDEAAVSKNGDIEHIRSSSTNWINFILNFITLFTATVDQRDHTTGATQTLWSTHMEDFVSNCLVKLLRYQLSMIIFPELEFDVFTPVRDQLHELHEGGATHLNKRWTTFFSSEILHILPSTLTNQPNGTSETHATAVSKAITKLMGVCELWWNLQWNANKWNQRVSSLRIRHERRIRCATWLAATKPIEGEATSITRIQLLEFLSSQVFYINALLTDQVAVEASVLELAQQMDYLASGFDDSCPDPHSANENLHTLIQSCYGNVVNLFEYGRTLADLVQGISVIETSSGEATPETKNVELEVDATGKILLQTASKAKLQIQTSKAMLNEMTSRGHALQNELKDTRRTYDTLAKRKCTVEKEFHALGLEKKDAVLELARALSRNVKDMRNLFQHFDKLKTPSKQNQALSAIMGSEGSRRQGQIQTIPAFRQA
ncbi:Phosphatidylinositol kinase [Phytophthora megakarya]|uniref:Phosphatidylinositol kinase n=1 Tax=Phytophthora megakarya TaxID=4795 RepID=A0A225WSH6_9STRA|nr:Phosphatidylinositol kinase [Phytophthora megakarya]